MSAYKKLLEKIQKKNAEVGIIGLGYVGLPLACEFAHAGLKVTGFDVVASKVDTLNNGESYIQDVPSTSLKELVSKKRFSATTDFDLLQKMDVISICVPTPLRKTKDPDMSFIVSAVDAIKSRLRVGQLIVLESTTYPGTTEEAVLPVLEETGLKVGIDFFLSFSPERVDPGNKRYNTRNTPKVIGGVTKECSHLTEQIYANAIQTLVLVSSPRSAEMVKLYENTFRSVNIAMANEMVLMCDKLGIDVWEIIDAAATKPFGFMPFYPGPGLGGHCIPIDPLYLSWKLKALNYDAKFISLAGEINGHMPEYVVHKISAALNHHKKSVNGARILILGIAYKPNVNDVRESPALDIIVDLQKLGALVSFHDDLNPECEIGEQKLSSVALSKRVLQDADCVVIIANHSYIKIEDVVTHSRLLVDTRNATKGFSKETIFRL